MKIRLGDADRERLGCPEWMELDLTTMSVAEAEALEASGGDWTVIHDSGAKAMKTRIWLALHRSGVTVPFSELTFDVIAAKAQDDSGKAEGSDNDELPTPPTSASSTPRSPRKRSQAST